MSLAKFIQDDEYILLMEDFFGGEITPGDRAHLREIGVQTSVRYLVWRKIEPEPGIYDWSYPDECVRLSRQAGMKTMLSIYDLAPAYFPGDWYLKFPDGRRFGGTFYANMISPWNPAAWQRHLDFIQACCDRYAAPDVLPYRGTMHGGECMLPDYGPCRMDGYLYSTVIRMLLEEQAIFYEAHPVHELWTALHHAFDSQWYTGNQHWFTLYQAQAQRFPDALHYHLVHTQWVPNIIGAQEHVRDIAEHGYPTFCGSEYCEGLDANTEAAIEAGFRGFITGPLHGLSGHRSMEPWMFDSFANSLAKWKAARR